MKAQNDFLMLFTSMSKRLFVYLKKNIDMYQFIYEASNILIKNKLHMKILKCQISLYKVNRIKKKTFSFTLNRTTKIKSDSNICESKK